MYTTIAVYDKVDNPKKIIGKIEGRGGEARGVAVPPQNDHN
jgi:hypothetical protein